MAELARIDVYPVKSLAPATRERTAVVENGGLAGDREFAIVDADGDYVNGKRTPAVHRLRTTYEFEDGRAVSVRIRERDGEASSFSLADPGGREDLAAWLSAYFGQTVSLRRNRAGGFPDDTDDAGPTLLSTATLRAVADWFDLPVASVRRRFRANLEVGGVPPFWEDGRYREDGPGRLRVGDCEIRVTGPVNRCVVPTRDPDTGEATPGFAEQFRERRLATLPEWVPEARFDHGFKLAVNTRVPRESWGTTLAVGDRVRPVEP